MLIILALIPHVVLSALHTSTLCCLTAQVRLEARARRALLKSHGRMVSFSDSSPSASGHVDP